MAGGGLAALLSPLVATHFEDWQAGLGVWLLPALGALLLWAWLPLGAAKIPRWCPHSRACAIVAPGCWRCISGW